MNKIIENNIPSSTRMKFPTVLDFIKDDIDNHTKLNQHEKEIAKNYLFLMENCPWGDRDLYNVIYQKLIDLMSKHPLEKLEKFDAEKLDEKQKKEWEDYLSIEELLNKHGDKIDGIFELPRWYINNSDFIKMRENILDKIEGGFPEFYTKYIEESGKTFENSLKQVIEEQEKIIIKYEELLKLKGIENS